MYISSRAGEIIYIFAIALRQIFFHCATLIVTCQGLNALKEHPDLIITDIHIPAMDGIAIMHKIHEDLPWGQNVHIFILTNYDSDDSQLSQINSDHPTFYLLKVKATIDKIIEKVQEVLK